MLRTATMGAGEVVSIRAELRADARGASAAEYTIVIALIALVALGAWTALGDSVSEQVRCVAGAVGASGGPCEAGAGMPGATAEAGPAAGAPRATPSRDRGRELAETLVGRGGSATDAQRDALVDAVATLPLGLLEHLEQQGTRIVAVNGSVADAIGRLRDTRPRGWMPGSSYDDVHGIFDHLTNQVVIGVDANGGVTARLVAHEIGHALDYHAGGRALDSAERAFVDAYERARATLVAHGEHYFLQPGAAGREELFAESLALMVTNPQALRRKLPAIYEYWLNDPAGVLDRTRARVASNARPRAGAELPPPNPFGKALGFVDDHVGKPIARHVVEPAVGLAARGAQSAWDHGGRTVWNRASRAYSWTSRASERMQWLVSAAPPADPRKWREWATFRFNAAVGMTNAAWETAKGTGALVKWALTPPSRRDRIHWDRVWATARALPGSFARQIHTCATGPTRAAGRACGSLEFDGATFVVPGGAFARGGRLAGAAGRASVRGTRGSGALRPAVSHGLCFAAGTEVRLGTGAAATIETLRVGARVRTLDGGAARASVIDASWRVVRLAMPDPAGSGDVFHVELLRSGEWLAAIGASQGQPVELALREIGVEGEATIESIEPAPAIDAGEGRVVLATVRSTSASVLVVRFEGTGEVLEPTARHPLYSLDRRTWVRAGDLRAGERLRTASGSVTVASVEPKGGSEPVYNLEVDADHSFLVSSLEVLSHNNNPCAAAAGRTLTDVRFHEPPTALDAIEIARSRPGRARESFGWGGGTRDLGDGRWEHTAVAHSKGNGQPVVRIVSHTNRHGDLLGQPIVTVWDDVPVHVQLTGPPARRPPMTSLAHLDRPAGVRDVFDVVRSLPALDRESFAWSEGTRHLADGRVEHTVVAIAKSTHQPAVRVVSITERGHLVGEPTVTIYPPAR